MRVLSSSRTVASSILCIVILCLLLFGLQSDLPRYTLSIHDQLTQSTITETKSSDFFQPLHHLIDSLSLRPLDELPNPKPSILIFQHLPYFTPLYRASYATRKLYSEIWGYGYKCSRYSKIGDGDGPRKVNNGKSVKKVYALYEVFKDELKKDENESIADVDTIISNPSIPIHFLLPPPTLDPPPMFLGNQDHNGFNAGVLIFRIHPHILKLLEWVIIEFGKSLEGLKKKVNYHVRIKFFSLLRRTSQSCRKTGEECWKDAKDGIKNMKFLWD
ncbi:hypothetical protein I204_01415 [Kwoniella mangroviensis CBS 8886]|nr:hypothetical protein I204_01415 [Kwoniella mangroviensis CBS 8886]